MASSASDWFVGTRSSVLTRATNIPVRHEPAENFFIGYVTFGGNEVRLRPPSTRYGRANCPNLTQPSEREQAPPRRAVRPASGRSPHVNDCGSIAAMWPRKRLDIGWVDVAALRASFVFRWNRRRAAANVLAAWPADGQTLPTMSVRSGLHLILGQLDWPRGSEILMSAMTIPDMARIVRYVTGTWESRFIGRILLLVQC